MTATRFSRRSVAKFWWVPTISSGSLVPSHTEVLAGIHVTPQIAEVAGFTFDNAPITTPNMEEAFTPQVPGEDTAADSSLTLYELKGGTDSVHAGLPKGNAGYMVIFPRGIAGASPAAADVCDVWPATIGSNSRTYTAANEAGRYMVKFSITQPPVEDVTLT